MQTLVPRSISSYFAFFCAAHRFRCASAILALASALILCFFPRGFATGVLTF